MIEVIDKYGNKKRVTEKLFHKLYKYRGFRIDSKEFKTDYEGYTKAELMDILDDRGIEYTTRDTKSDLIAKVI